MKYKVMIVEDEKIERDAIILMVHLSHPNVEVVCSAENGLEAMRLFKIHLPDIVVMDVDLPGISGLEAIQEMQPILPDTQYIILSAYNIFNYAQRALKLGVHEYLLKPCTTQELNDAINSVIENIDASRTIDNTGKIFQEKINEIRPILESECIFSIASLRKNVSLSQMFDFLNIRVQSGFVFVIRSENGCRKVLSSVKANMETMGITCIGDILNSLCVFVVLSEKVLVNNQVQELIQFLSSLIEHGSLKCQIGIGRVGNSAEGLSKSYEEALRALTYIGPEQNMCALYEDAMSNIVSVSFDTTLASKRICAQLRLNNPEGVAQEVEKAFSQLMLLNESKEVIDSLIYRMYVQILSVWDKQLDESVFSALTIENIHNESDVCAISTRIIRILCNLMKSAMNTNSGYGGENIATKIIEYIREHYAENINLNQLAARFSITPFYLSRIVKRHTGKTYTDYLTHYRIAQAKMLIQQGNLSVKEITYAVGFNSQNYFTKVFKKYTGFTPSEFRVENF